MFFDAEYGIVNITSSGNVTDTVSGNTDEIQAALFLRNKIREQELCICGVGWIEKTTRRKGLKMRTSGILLPVASLPSRYGIGCFSKEAYEFVDRLEEAGQSYWQILPL